MLSLSAQRRRALRENVTAYTFLLPALTLIFIFGIFPVGFALYVSLHRWRRFPGEFVGLAQYERALGEFAYIVFFWLAIAALAGAAVSAWRLIRGLRQSPRAVPWLVPGISLGVTTLLTVNWLITALPAVLDVPQRIRGVARSTGLFLSELIASFQQPQVVEAGTWMLLGIGVTLVLYVICAWLLRDDSDSAPVLQGAAIVILTGIGLWTLQLTLTDLNAAIEAAREAGESLPIWTQMILISAGIGLLALAWVLWRSAPKREHSGVFIVQMGAAAALLSAGYILVAQLPIVLANADDDLLRGFNVTVMYTIGTVPIQLFFGLLLAYLLFQKIRLKSMFRVLYFLPYVTPFIATSIVFGILFSHRPTSPVNQVLSALGMPVQRWLLEPTGLFQLVFGPGVPDILSGPSLALCVIIIYTAWTYIGYATVVFLAGLGNVQPDLYEAARIDGAGEWNLFRRITLPLLSPTTFFLTLITVIGTLQSFTQIYILRTPAAASTVDTVGVLIYETIGATEPNMGYGSALSLVLFTVILIFTFVQNRVARNRVFYG